MKQTSMNTYLQESFVAEVNHTGSTGLFATHHESARHKVPKEWTRMTKPGPKNKDWPSITDDAMLKAVAAWNWLHAYFLHYNTTSSIRPMSKLMLNLTVVRFKPTNVAYASMGNFEFAALGLI